MRLYYGQPKVKCGKYICIFWATEVGKPHGSPHRGIEPRFSAWQAEILSTILISIRLTLTLRLRQSELRGLSIKTPFLLAIFINKADGGASHSDSVSGIHALAGGWVRCQNLGWSHYYYQRVYPPFLPQVSYMIPVETEQPFDLYSQDIECLCISMF